MSDNKDVSGTGGGGDGVGAASAVREARASAEREARSARWGADGAAPGVNSGSGHENDDVELISLNDTPGAGGPEANLADDSGDKTGAGGALGDTPGAVGPEPNPAGDWGDKTGAGGAKPNLADADEVVLTLLGDKTGAGGGDPSPARAVAEAE